MVWPHYHKEPAVPFRWRGCIGKGRKHGGSPQVCSFFLTSTSSPIRLLPFLCKTCFMVFDSLGDLHPRSDMRIRGSSNRHFSVLELVWTPHVRWNASVTPTPWQRHPVMRGWPRRARSAGLTPSATTSSSAPSPSWKRASSCRPVFCRNSGATSGARSLTSTRTFGARCASYHRNRKL